MVVTGTILSIGLPVAFKTTKAGCPSSALKGMMSEIKVLLYLGKHENIVTILGAYTAEIKQGFKKM